MTPGPLSPEEAVNVTPGAVKCESKLVSPRNSLELPQLIETTLAPCETA